MTKEELEKEAREYALEWGDKTDGTYACCRDGYLASAEPREKRIENLEKENAELKEKLEYRNCVDCSNHGSNIKLLKAKAIIKNILQTLKNDDFDFTFALKSKHPVLQEAEQFLKEE